MIVILQADHLSILKFSGQKYDVCPKREREREKEFEHKSEFIEA